MHNNRSIDVLSDSYLRGRCPYSYCYAEGHFNGFGERMGFKNSCVAFCFGYSILPAPTKNLPLSEFN